MKPYLKHCLLHQILFGGLKSRLAVLVADDLDRPIGRMPTIALTDSILPPTRIRPADFMVMNAASGCLVIRYVMCVAGHAVGVPRRRTDFLHLSTFLRFTIRLTMPTQIILQKR